MSIVLDTTTRSLQFKLGAAVATNQLPFVASYQDSTNTLFGSNNGTSNNTTAVTLVSAPAQYVQRLIKSLAIQNADTAAATVTIIYDDNTTLRNIIVATLAVGDQLIYEDGQGWTCLDKNGNIKTSSGGGGGVTSVSNSDGTLTISPTTGAAVASLAALSSGKILVGNGSNIATGVPMSGDATLANTGAITVTETSGKAFTSYATAATGQLAGTATNDNASAGNIGEYISSSIPFGSAVSLTNSTTANVTSISLSAGDWDVQGDVIFVLSSSTSTTTEAAISTTSATMPTPPGGGLNFNSVSTNQNSCLQTGVVRISIASTTTVYLLAQSQFTTGTESAYGFIGARRAR